MLSTVAERLITQPQLEFIGMGTITLTVPPAPRVQDTIMIMGLPPHTAESMVKMLLEHGGESITNVVVESQKGIALVTFEDAKGKTCTYF